MDGIFKYSFTNSVADFEKSGDLNNVLNELTKWAKDYCFARYVMGVKFVRNNDLFEFQYNGHYVSLAHNISECLVLVRTFHSTMILYCK